MKIILIAGKAKSGKSTLASLIAEKLQAQNKTVLKTEYSKYLKMYAKEVLNWSLSSNKPRTFLQETGSFLRKYDESIFIRRMLEDFLVYEKYFQYVIISDVRLIKEITALKEKYPDILTIKVVNDYASYDLSSKEASHITEKELETYNDFTYIIKNKNIDQLDKIASEIVEEIL